MRHLTIVALGLLLALGLPALAADNPASKHFLAGEQFLAKGQLDQAIDEYVLALQLKPDSALSKTRLVLAQSRKVDGLNAELGRVRGKLGITEQGMSAALEAAAAKLNAASAGSEALSIITAMPAPASTSATSNPNDLDKTISDQDTTITSLRRSIALLKLAHPETFAPVDRPEHTFVELDDAIPIESFADSVYGIRHNRSLTKAQCSAQLQALCPRKVKCSTIIQNVSLNAKGGSTVLHFGNGGKFSAEARIPRALALSLNKGTACTLRGTITATALGSLQVVGASLNVNFHEFNLDRVSDMDKAYHL